MACSLFNDAHPCYIRKKRAVKIFMGLLPAHLKVVFSLIFLLSFCVCRGSDLVWLLCCICCLKVSETEMFFKQLMKFPS